jgi:hypothetical protein
MLPPAGAAIVASRLTLYAALVKGGAKAPAGSPPADQAAALAKRILLAWASRGFRDQHGNFLNRAEQFCDGQQRFNRLEENNVGLQIARGVIYSVHAQDLLQSITAFNAAETTAINAFHPACLTSLWEFRADASFCRPTSGYRHVAGAKIDNPYASVHVLPVSSSLVCPKFPGPHPGVFLPLFSVTRRTARTVPL